MRSRRIACLLMPRFSLEVCLRVKPSLAGRPVAIAQGASRREIMCASVDAVGVQTGMTPKQARAACPGLVVVARDEIAERAAVMELLDALEACGPGVEGRAPGLCFFDAMNLPAGEAATLGAAMAVAGALGFASAAAIADDKFTAQCAASVCRDSAAARPELGATMVPANGSAAFLSSLPIALLPLAPGDAERLDLLGLRSMGQIAALPPGPLAARFGERAREYALLARGEDGEPLRPRGSTQPHEERFAFDGAVDRLEPLLFALRGCVTGVACRLAGAAQACDKVEIILEGGSRVTNVCVALAEPTASAATMFDLVRIALESREDLGPVEAAIVRAAPCGLPPPQLALFDGASASRRAALAATLARLHATLGEEEVVTIEPTPTRSRLPERMQRAVPVVSPQQMLEEEGGGRRASRSTIKVDRSEVDRPEVKRSDGLGATGTWAPALRLVSPPKPIDAPPDASARAGPFRLSESWWERPVDRDYYQMVDRAGGLLLVFRDLCDGKWYLQGVFD
jgi:protein ImuB